MSSGPRSGSSGERDGASPELSTLGEGEELIDAATFANMHAQLALSSRRLGEPSPEEELLLEQIATELPAPSADPVAAPRSTLTSPAGPQSAVALETLLMSAESRDAVVEMALRLAQRHARSAGLLVVRDGIIAGLRGAGGGIEERIAGVVIPDKLGSVFADVAASGRTHVGPHDGGAIDIRLLRALGRADAEEFFLGPIAIGSRIVGLLYADNDDHPLGLVQASALSALCGCIARGYEHLIAARKRAASPA